ncbi:DEAD/DEAH box helicase [bacterium]|nr:DEAD/DEAH box helicase [bacterium]
MSGAHDGPLLPPRTGIDYLPHQLTGVRWMIEREEADAPLCRGGVLADDMGLGKTFQTIGLLRNSSERDWQTLILCPPALIAGWKEELMACGYCVAQMAGGGASWSVTGDKKLPRVWLSTYPRTPDIAEGLLVGRSSSKGWPTGGAWERVVLDEGHCIRNGTGTARGGACAAIGGRAVARWVLSATPVQNSARDWRVLCAWLRVAAEEVADAAETVLLRRTMGELRETMAALPPAPRFVGRDLRIPDGAGAAGAEGRLFRALCDRLESVMDQRSVSALEKLELYLRIQQFLVHPQIYVEGMRAKFGRSGYPRPDWTGSATKWQACMTDLAAAVRESVPTIVFCQFRAEMDRVEATAREMGAAVWSVRGGMGAEAVGSSVAAARTAAEGGKTPVVFVCQIVSGGVGLNLQFCRRVLFLSQHWNPAVVHQAVGRAVRIGQRAVVEVVMYRVVDEVMDNLDRRMVELHIEKIGAARSVCESLYEGFAPLDETALSLG